MHTSSPFAIRYRRTDVRRLIDHLARNPDFSQRSEELTHTLGPPMSVDSWITVMREHPQFFEDCGGKNPIALRARMHKDSDHSPLTEDEIKQLDTWVTQYAEC